MQWNLKSFASYLWAWDKDINFCKLQIYIWVIFTVLHSIKYTHDILLLNPPNFHNLNHEEPLLPSEGFPLICCGSHRLVAEQVTSIYGTNYALYGKIVKLRTLVLLNIFFHLRNGATLKYHVFNWNPRWLPMAILKITITCNFSSFRFRS